MKYAFPLSQLPPSQSSLAAAPVTLLHPRGLGDVDPIGKTVNNLNVTQKVMLAVHGVIVLAVAYHGFKRNKSSVAWGAGWALGGVLCPTVTMAFALTQGFAKRKKKE